MEKLSPLLNCKAKPAEVETENILQEKKQPVQEIVVNPRVLKSSSKDKAGIALSSSFMSIYEMTSTKDIFLSRAKRLNIAMA